MDYPAVQQALIAFAFAASAALTLFVGVHAFRAGTRAIRSIKNHIGARAR